MMLPFLQQPTTNNQQSTVEQSMQHAACGKQHSLQSQQLFIDINTRRRRRCKYAECFLGQSIADAAVCPVFVPQIVAQQPHCLMT